MEELFSMYARLEGDCLIKAPNFIVVNGFKMWNASSEEYLLQGWYPVVLTEEPIVDEYHYAESWWEMVDNQIIQRWQVKEIDITEADMLEAARIMLGMD